MKRKIPSIDRLYELQRFMTPKIHGPLITPTRFPSIAGSRNLVDACIIDRLHTVPPPYVAFLRQVRTQCLSQSGGIRLALLLLALKEERSAKGIRPARHRCVLGVHPETTTKKAQKSDMVHATEAKGTGPSVTKLVNCQETAG